MGILRTDKISGLETPTAVTGSVVFDGTGDSLTIASTNDFAFGTGDFTVEMWVYHTNLTGQQTYFGDTYGNTAGLYTYKTGTNQISLYDSTQRSVSAANIIQVNTWYHVAWTRESGILRAFLDGVKVDEDAHTVDYTTTQYYVGDTADSSSGEMIGYISNLRVLKGTALYTSDFTVPVHELEVIGDTVLLCCNNPDSAGADETGKTITANNDAAASTFSPGLTRDFTSGTEFKGVTTFDTQGYFVPPSGTTEQRGRGRGLIGGGENQSGQTNSIEYIQIQSTGNAQDFGDLSVARDRLGGGGNQIRGIFAGGSVDPHRNVIEYVTIATTGNSKDFGDLAYEGYAVGAAANSTRWLAIGSYGLNHISYVTISSLGDAQDFGDLREANDLYRAAGSPTRCVMWNKALRSFIQYVTWASKGNSQDFGHQEDHGVGGACSDSTRAIRFGGEDTPGSNKVNRINYITISSLGNEQDFGDLTNVSWGGDAVSNSIRGAHCLGSSNPSEVNTIDYVTIQTTGNAQDFGDLIAERLYYQSTTSDSHGAIS